MYNNDINIPNVSLRRMLDFFLNEVRIDVHMTDLYGNVIGYRFQRDHNEWLKFATRFIYEVEDEELNDLLDMPVCKVEPRSRDYIRIEVLADAE